MSTATILRTNSPAEENTECVSCQRVAVIFPELQMVEQYAYGSVQYFSTAPYEAGGVQDWDCANCGMQNTLY